MHANARDDLSWSYGPANSRLVRTLFYLAEGALWGLVASQVLVLAWLAVGAHPWLLGVLAVFLVLAVRWASLLAKISKRSGRYAHRDIREWVAVRRWPLVLAAAVLFASAFLAAPFLYWWLDPGVGLEWWWRYTSGDRLVFFGGFLFGIVLLVLARSLSTDGEIDPEALTLSYRQRDGIDLSALAGARRFAVGPYTVLWLRFEPGVRDRTVVQGFYVIPTPIVERAWPVFEAGLAADTEVAGRESTPRDRSFRTTTLGIVVGYAALAVGALALLYALGAPRAALEMVAYVFAVLGIVFAWVAVKSI